MPDLLFVYGTLHPDRAPAEIAAEARQLRHVSPATIEGRLYDLGPYPGVHLGGNTQVPGHLFQLPHAPDILPALDAYEGYLPATPALSLFLRVKTIATQPDGSTTQCWVYVYNQTIP
jgi:gamma-glutamylcyclotransferase (GGCT)/AIG2-like uncharacterized protein YtfP